MNALAQMSEMVAGQRETEVPMQPKLDQTRTMRALVWRGKSSVEYTEVPRPLITDSRDIILRVIASSVCGSDLHLYSGAIAPMKDGDILGHEFIGVVEEWGDSVRGLNKGQRVAVAFDIACGTCDFCQRQEFTACSTTNPSNLIKQKYGHRTSALYGYSHLNGGVPGGQAEYVRVPYAEINCLPIPDDVPDEKALFLTDVIPTAFHGCELAKIKEGDRVAIWGLGPIGLMVAKICQMKKASLIVGIDHIEERLNCAMKTLNIETINFGDQDVLKTLDKRVPDGFDAVIECAGFEYSTSLLHKVERALSMESDTADIFDEMFTAVRPFGHVGVLGVYTGYANHFPVGAMMEKGLTVACGQAPVQKYWKDCLTAIQAGELDPTFLITHHQSLRDLPDIYKKFYNKEEGMLKVFLRPENFPVS